MTDLHALLAPVKCVLFDFDGPVCRLYDGYPAAGVAEGLREWVLAEGYELGTAARRTDDPMVLLLDIGRRYGHGGVVEEVEARLTAHEVVAVGSAEPTPDAVELIRALKAVGASLAITSNNSPEAVTSYLTGRDLRSCFGPHIYGRTRDLARLKPDPDCVLRALASTGAAAADALMIGDTPEDCEAAREAGVTFLGFARNASKGKLLNAAGAQHVVGALRPLLDAVRTR
ncbi:HAD family hydrolase [Streptomyces sp. NPDC060194]|uniref:HAD family hydrolase n=1 Tax=Streptomyces sp. NPDC060194 TaxID=3347069 RepID=UPI00365DA7FF